MNIKRITIYISLLFLVGEVVGQAPGLAGKRFSVFYENAITGNTFRTSFNQAQKAPIDDSDLGVYGIGSVDPRRVFNMQHSIQLDYTTGRFQSIGVGLGVFRNGYGVFEDNDIRLLSKNFVARSLSVHWKRFSKRRGSIAPLGIYREYSLFMYNVNDFWSENPDFFPNPVRINERNYNLAAFTINFGRQTVITKEYLFNIGVEMGMVIPLAGSGESMDSLYRKFLSPEPTTVAERMASFHFFRLKIGIGLISF